MAETVHNATSGDGMPNSVYGFVGLGNMGFGMAKKLRASMPKQCRLVVCDINTKRRDEFMASVDGLVETAESPRQVMETCVCLSLHSKLIPPIYF